MKKVKPSRCYAIVDARGLIACDGGVPLLFYTSAQAKNWIALAGDRVVRVEVREAKG